MNSRGIPVWVPLVWFFLLFPVPRIAGQTPVPSDDTLTVEIWSTDDRIVHGDTTVEQRLLREALFTISGMIYGFDFVYTPEYHARGVERLFELSPVSRISWGDPRLVVREIYDDRNTLYGLIDYTLSEADRARLQSWRRIDVDRAAGIGGAPLLTGLDGKIGAIEEAIVAAVRSYLQERYQNRPREVTGTVTLREPPRIRTVSGSYEAQVKISIHVAEVREYRIF